MTDSDRDARECEALTRYLVGSSPSAYVLASYRRLRPSAEVAEGRLDRALDAAVRLGPAPARVADAYARRFRPTGSLRRRLTLMLAILENAPDTWEQTSAGTAVGPVAGAARMAVTLAASGVALLVGIVVFGPIDLMSGGSPAATK
jgi:hypothetical protein